jgi:hypothetical protein
MVDVCSCSSSYIICQQHTYCPARLLLTLLLLLRVVLQMRKRTLVLAGGYHLRGPAAAIVAAAMSAAAAQACLVGGSDGKETQLQVVATVSLCCSRCWHVGHSVACVCTSQC